MLKINVGIESYVTKQDKGNPQASFDEFISE